jgi:hypothetical protein
VQERRGACLAHAALHHLLQLSLADIHSDSLVPVNVIGYQLCSNVYRLARCQLAYI